MPLTVIARLTAVEGQEAILRAELEKLVAPTRAEPGCQAYDLHEDMETPGTFVFVEIWDDADALAAHGGSDHIRAFREGAREAIAGRHVSRLNRIA